MHSKILVTGAAGFIGMHTVLRLLEAGHEVVGLDNLNDYYSVDLKIARLAHCGIFRRQFVEGEIVRSITFQKYVFVKEDLQDTAAINKLFQVENFDYVINLAGQAGVRYSLENPHSYIASNVSGFLVILEACRKFPVKHLLYASSSSVYGLNTKLPFHEGDKTDTPISLYAATKKANELMAHSYSHLFNIRSTGLRFFTVYGPWGRPDMALFSFTKSILNNEPIKLFNSGRMIRDFTYVGDIVSAILNLLFKRSDDGNNGALAGIFNIGNSKPSSVIEYVNAIEESIGREAIKESHPLQAGDLLATHADVSALDAYVGYAPKTSIREGVRAFVNWYFQHYEKIEIAARKYA